MGAVMPTDKQSVVSDVRFTATGIEFLGEISRDDWMILGNEIASCGRFWQWFWLDWVKYGLDRGYTAHALRGDSLIGKAQQTVRTVWFTGRLWKREDRIAGVPFSKYAVIRFAPASDRSNLLARSMAGGWDEKRTRFEVRESCKVNYREKQAERDLNNPFVKWIHGKGWGKVKDFTREQMHEAWLAGLKRKVWKMRARRRKQNDADKRRAARAASKVARADFKDAVHRLEMERVRADNLIAVR
jgi:hypothetical protein